MSLGMLAWAGMFLLSGLAAAAVKFGLFVERPYHTTLLAVYKGQLSFSALW